VLRRADALVRMSYESSRTSWRIRQGTANVSLRGSVFCSVRDRSAEPLCGYHAAAYQRMLSMFDLPASVTIESCRAAGATECVLSVPFAALASAEEAEAA